MTRRLGWLTLGATFLLVFAGGLVHSTGSALACPDWPLCYGSPVPEMTGGVFYEHSHRLLGALVGVLTAALAAALLRRWRGDRQAAVLGWIAYGLIVVQVLLTGRLGVMASQQKLTGESADPTVLLRTAAVFGVLVLALAAGLCWRRRERLPALGLVLGEIVVFQATLGGTTVLLRLPTAVSTAHLATSMLYLVGVVVVLFGLRQAPADVMSLRDLADLDAPARHYRSRPLALAAFGVYLQMLLGALVRHTGAGLACHTDLLLCQGALLPGTGPGWLLFSHRLGALAVAALVWWAAAAPLRRVGTGLEAPRATRIGAHLARGLVLVQIALGVLTVSTHIAIPLATAHLLAAALLLVTLVALALAWSAPPNAARVAAAPAAPLVSVAISAESAS